jgi:hypothetical protein
MLNLLNATSWSVGKGEFRVKRVLKFTSQCSTILNVMRQTHPKHLKCSFSNGHMRNGNERSVYVSLGFIITLQLYYQKLFENKQLLVTNTTNCCEIVKNCRSKKIIINNARLVTCV